MGISGSQNWQKVTYALDYWAGICSLLLGSKVTYAEHYSGSIRGLNGVKNGHALNYLPDICLSQLWEKGLYALDYWQSICDQKRNIIKKNWQLGNPFIVIIDGLSKKF